MTDAAQILEHLERIERAVAFRPAWIAGNRALGGYIGSNDASGRKAKSWAAAERLHCKVINGTPHYSLSDVDRAMRNGRAIETR
jgi:hypothetical protein